MTTEIDLYIPVGDYGRQDIEQLEQLTTGTVRRITREANVDERNVAAVLVTSDEETARKFRLAAQAAEVECRVVQTISGQPQVRFGDRIASRSNMFEVAAVVSQVAEQINQSSRR